jgi:hypothetical protein
MTNYEVYSKTEVNTNIDFLAQFVCASAITRKRNCTGVQISLDNCRNHWNQEHIEKPISAGDGNG